MRSTASGATASRWCPGDIFDYFGLDLPVEELKAKGFRVWTPPQEKGAWISEGDTSTFMNLIDNGLRAHEDAELWRLGWPKRAGQGRHGRVAARLRDGALVRVRAARLRRASEVDGHAAFAGANHEPIVTIHERAESQRRTRGHRAARPRPRAIRTRTPSRSSGGNTPMPTPILGRSRSPPDASTTTFQVPDGCHARTNHPRADSGHGQRNAGP